MTRAPQLGLYFEIKKVKIDPERSLEVTRANENLNYFFFKPYTSCEKNII